MSTPRVLPSVIEGSEEWVGSVRIGVSPDGKIIKLYAQVPRDGFEIKSAEVKAKPKSRPKAKRKVAVAPPAPALPNGQSQEGQPAQE